MDYAGDEDELCQQWELQSTTPSVAVSMWQSSADSLLAKEDAVGAVGLATAGMFIVAPAAGELVGDIGQILP